MLDLNGTLESMIKELRQVVASVSGVTNVQENINIEYIALVESEEHKEAVEKVGSLLTSQATNFGFGLEVIPVTKEELAQAESSYAEYLNSQTKFKS